MAEAPETHTDLPPAMLIEATSRLFSLWYPSVIQSVCESAISPTQLLAWRTPPIPVLFARYFGRSEWHSEIPLLKQIATVIERGNFVEMKYLGCSASEQHQMSDQLKGASIAQRSEWIRNSSELAIITARSPIANPKDALMAAQNILSQLLTTLPSTENDDVKMLAELLTTQSDKEIIKYLLLHYPRNTTFRQCAVMKAMISMTEITDLNTTISRTKSIKDVLGLTIAQIATLNSAHSLLRSKPASALVVYATFDDPRATLRSPQLVEAFSCQDPTCGRDLQSLLANVIDANVKSFAGFVLRPGKGFPFELYTQLHEMLSKNPTSVQHSIDSELRELIITLGAQQVHIPLGSALFRRSLKVGTNASGEFRLKSELLHSQQHDLLQEIVERSKAFVFATFPNIPNSESEMVRIAPSRNPGGAYSDLGGGIQQGAYWI